MTFERKLDGLFEGEGSAVLEGGRAIGLAHRRCHSRAIRAARDVLRVARVDGQDGADALPYDERNLRQALEALAETERREQR